MPFTGLVKPDGSVDPDSIQYLPLAWNVTDNPFGANIGVVSQTDTQEDTNNPYRIDNTRRFRSRVSMYSKVPPMGLRVMGGSPYLEDRPDGAILDRVRGDVIQPQLSDLGADAGFGLPTKVVMSIGDGGFIDPMNPNTRIFANKNLSGVQVVSAANTGAVRTDLVGSGAPVISLATTNLGTSADPTAGGEAPVTIDMNPQTKVTLAVLAIILLLVFFRR